MRFPILIIMLLQSIVIYPGNPITFIVSIDDLIKQKKFPKQHSHAILSFTHCSLTSLKGIEQYKFTEKTPIVVDATTNNLISPNAIIIKHIDLTANNLTQVTISLLRDLKTYFPSLKLIDLRENPLTNEEEIESVSNELGYMILLPHTKLMQQTNLVKEYDQSTESQEQTVDDVEEQPEDYMRYYRRLTNSIQSSY